MKDLYQFINNKNKISYTLKKAYDIGFADPNPYKKNHLAIIHKMKSSITNTYMRNKIAYTEVNFDFMNIIPYLNNVIRMNELISDMTIQYYHNREVVDDMMEGYLLEQMERKKIIFMNVCINNYNTERCEEEESVHGTSMIFIPHKNKYYLYYINSHGLDMKDYNEFHIIKTKSRCKVLKYDNVIDFIFLERLTNYFNTKCGDKIVYKKDKIHNYWGADFQGGDNHGICFVFPYLIFYNLCKHYTEKKALLNGLVVDKFKKLLLDGNIDRLVHSCFVDFMKDVEDIDDTNMIDDLVVKLNYRFTKKVSNCFVAYISQSCFS